MAKKSYLLMIILAAVLVIAISGCGKKDDNENVASNEEVIVEEKDYLSVDTSIFYSAGNDGNWSYGNQRKEFPNNEACYVRIGSTAITSGSFGKGVDEEITVTYRFTGAENCKIEVSEGKVIQADTDNSNVVEFTRILTAAKEKNAKESVVIFRYVPEDAERVTLEVLYDDQIAEKYDMLNTVYFEEP